MEIENKIDDKWVIVRKDPEPGDLVQYKYHPRDNGLGLVLRTYNQGFEGDDLETAKVMWDVNDHEDEPFLDLQVVSCASVFYD